MFVANLLLYILAFILIWKGAGLIIAAAAKFSHRLRLSPFVFSFVFLGILTSTPEFSVGLQAVADHNASIFVGTLLGGIIVLFLVAIPILAIFGGKLNIRREMERSTLIATLLVIMAPALLVLDRRVTTLEGLFMIVLYGGLLFFVERKKGIFDRANTQLLDIKAYSYKDLLKIILGVGIMFVASNIIVDKTLYFAEYLNVAPFYISLLLVALGTSLPELSLGLRTITSGKKEVVMGDYLGAAAANTFLFGLFTLLHRGEVLTVSNFGVTFVFMAVALGVFYYFAQTKSFFTRKYGLAMLGLYALFVVFEIL